MSATKFFLPGSVRVEATNCRHISGGYVVDVKIPENASEDEKASWKYWPKGWTDCLCNLSHEDGSYVSVSEFSNVRWRN